MSYESNGCIKDHLIYVFSIVTCPYTMSLADHSGDGHVIKMPQNVAPVHGGLSRTHFACSRMDEIHVKQLKSKHKC